MKSFAWCIVFMCVLAVPFTVASAQITIDTNDVKSQFAVGKSLTQYADTLTTSINIGAPGTTANTWNFSGLRSHLPQVLTSVSVATAPHANDFPGSTHALRTIVPLNIVFSGQTIVATVTLHQFLRLNVDLFNPGNWGSATGSIGGIPATGEVKTTNSVADRLYKLPSTLGTTWTSAYTSIQVVDVLTPIPLPGAVRDTTIHNARLTVDAFGTMTLPAPHGTQQALRIRKIDFVDNTPVLSYTFISKTGAIVNVTATDTLQPNSGTINIFRTSTVWNGPLPTDVRLSEAVPAEFALKQNYPNPFNPSTTIRYQVAGQGFVSIKLYNLLGQQVATLVSEEKAPGTYELRWDAEGIPSGVYLYRMQSGTFSETRRMVLLK